MRFTMDPLPANDELYMAPQAELERLVRACTQRAQGIWLVQGEYRMGKSSFFNAAKVALEQKGVVPCVVDFGSVVSEDLPGLLAWLANEVTRATGVPIDGCQVENGFDLWRYLHRVIESLSDRKEQAQPPAIALLLENLSKLQENILQQVGSLIVALPNLRPRLTGLYGITLVLTGGIYLEDPKYRKLSWLNDMFDLSQSTTLTLPDLDYVQTQLLVKRGLQNYTELTPEQMQRWGILIYDYTGGHPALIHSLGTMLYERLESGIAPSDNLVKTLAEDLAASMATGPGSFRRRLERVDKEWRILSHAWALVGATTPYSRLDPNIRVLEALGLVKKCAAREGQCALHNQIFSQAVQCYANEAGYFSR